MSTDLRARISAHYEAIEESQDVIAPSEVMGLVESVRPIPVGRPKSVKFQVRGIGVAAGVAAAVVALVSIPLFLLGSGIDEGPTAETPVATTSITPTEQESPATVAEETEPASVPSPSTSAIAEILAPPAPITGMSWQAITPAGFGPASGSIKLIGGGDRFLVVHSASSIVSSSPDGLTWTTIPIEGSVSRYEEFVGWHDVIVGTSGGGASGGGNGQITPNSSLVSVIHPDGTLSTEAFDGQLLEVAIGSSGIVVIVANHHDRDGLRYADEDVVAWNLTGRDINEFRVFQETNGVLHVESTDGELTADYVLADHGYADLDTRFGSGWFSIDGESWTPIPDLPAARDWQIIGTTDGFIGISNGFAWHSSDGFEWRELGASPDGGGLKRWKQGALVGGDQNSWYLSSSGVEETSLGFSGLEGQWFTTGDFGIVTTSIDSETLDLNEIHYSPDAETWINTVIPPEMSDLDLTVSSDHWPIETVSNGPNVLMLMNQVTGEDSTTPVWFLGTPTTD